MLSGAPSDDAHHIIGHGMGGIGTKAPDWAVIPMTRGCHTTFHNKRDSTISHHQWRWVAKTLGKAIEEGKLVWKK